MVFMILLVLSVIVMGGLIVAVLSYKLDSGSDLQSDRWFAAWEKDDVLVKSSGPVRHSLSKKEFLPDSFCIEAKGNRLYINPLGLKEADKGDYILITNAHPDHFSPKDIKKVHDKETVILCPERAAEKLGAYNVRTVAPGDHVEFGPFRIGAVPTYSKGLLSHSKRDGKMGYLVGVDEFTLYHAGDTDYVRELEDIGPVTLALLPLEGGNMTMDAGEAAAFANALKSQAVMPMHYSLFEGAEKAFADRVDEGVEVIVYE